MSVKAIAVNPKDPAHFIAVELPQPAAGEHDLLVEVKAGQIQISRQRLKGISQVINCRYIVDVNKIILAEKWIV
jgi:hypothetical protein